MSLPQSKLRPGFPNAAPADILEAAWLRVPDRHWRAAESDQPIQRAESGAAVTGDDWFDQMEAELFSGGLTDGGAES